MGVTAYLAKTLSGLLLVVAVVLLASLAVVEFTGGGGSHPCVGSSAGLAATDCAAWIDLYDATGGASWSGSLQTANLRLDPCSCPNSGMKMCTGGRITALYLHKGGLVGTLPSSISQMSELTTLVAYINRLSGPIPTEMSTMKKLTFLQRAGASGCSLRRNRG